MNEIMEAVEMIKKACQLFREHGTPDTAALALEKGAKYFTIVYFFYV